MSKRRATRKPIGGGGAGNPASIANLKRGGTVAPAGNRRALRHGGYSEALVAGVDAELGELMDALGGVAPVQGPDGGVPPSHLPGLEAAAHALRRYRLVRDWCNLHGRLDEKGGVRPAATFELDCEKSYWRALDAFGLTPAAEAKLGNVLTRTASVAQAMSEEDPARRRSMLRDAGVVLDHDDHDEGELP